MLLINISLYFSILFPTVCTHQVSDLIVIEGDTLFISGLLSEDNSIDQFMNDNRVDNVEGNYTCEITSCYRKFYIVWELHNRRLFIKEIIGCCDNLRIEMKKLFGRKYDEEKGYIAKFANENVIITDKELNMFNFLEERKIIEVSLAKGRISKKEKCKIIDTFRF